MILEEEKRRPDPDAKKTLGNFALVINFRARIVFVK